MIADCQKNLALKAAAKVISFFKYPNKKHAQSIKNIFHNI